MNPACTADKNVRATKKLIRYPICGQECLPAGLPAEAGRQAVVGEERVIADFSSMPLKVAAKTRSSAAC